MTATLKRSLTPDSYPPTIKFRQPGVESPEDDWPEFVSLRWLYEHHILPEIGNEQSPASLKEDVTAINNWERYTRNADVRDIGRSDILALRTGMEKAKRSPATINKTWREIASMLGYAVEYELIAKAPSLGKGKKSKIVKESRKVQRLIVSDAEVNLMWSQCKHATYPRGTKVPLPQLWRVALCLLYMYGVRTVDLFGGTITVTIGGVKYTKTVRGLTWADVDYEERLLRFEATKTSKLQGLPLTDAVIDQLATIHGNTSKLFPGFDASGTVLQSGPHKGEIKRGFRHTWNTEIAAGLAPAVKIKHYREAMVTRHNRSRPGLGNWIAGHFMPGVSAQNYDYPTDEIREAIEATALPECFKS